VSVTRLDLKPSVERQNRDAFSVTAGLGALTAVLAAAGFAAGDVGKVASEETGAFLIALIAAISFGFLTFAAGLIKNHPQRERQLFVGANVVLLIGLIAGVVGAVLVSSNTRAPVVTASSEQSAAGPFVKVTVKDSGLNAFEIIRVRVEHLHRVGRNSELVQDEPFYSSTQGSDSDGKVDATINVPLPPDVVGLVRARAFLGNSSKGCDAHQNTTSCVMINVLRGPESPQLSTRFRGSTLLVSVTARDVTNRRMTMRAFGLTGPGKKRKPVELAVWSLTPDAGGAFRRQVAIRKTSLYHAVCVVASTRGAAATRRCPPRLSKRTDSWIRYRIPH
jgi:hypothetical protein